MKRLLPLILLVPFAAHAQQPHKASDSISRLEAVQLVSVIGAIGQYNCPGTGPGQQPIVPCFLKVSVSMRSALAHDMRILSEIVRETRGALPPNAAPADEEKLGAQTVPVEGLMKFTEADLDLANNPQITPALEAALFPLMKDQ